MIAGQAKSLGFGLTTFLFIALNILPLTAGAQGAKPRVPIGIDPGGPAVSIIADSGIDYTRPGLAQRLARDGEGELVGWDFVDNDRRPFESGDALATVLALQILGDAPTVRIAPFRAHGADRLALGRAAVYAARSPARIALFLLASDNRRDWDAFAEVLGHFKDLLVIVPAGDSAQSFPAGLGIDSVLSVAASDIEIASSGRSKAEVATPSGGRGATASASRIAALAARIWAAEPNLVGSALKARIIASATPLPSPHASYAVHGWIADPATISVSPR